MFKQILVHTSSPHRLRRPLSLTNDWHAPGRCTIITGPPVYASSMNFPMNVIRQGTGTQYMSQYMMLLTDSRINTVLISHLQSHGRSRTEKWRNVHQTTNQQRARGYSEVQSTHYNPYAENPSSNISCIARLDTWGLDPISRRVVVIR
jgi:hypothetical protein